MKVLIVAKTRQGVGACIGGIAADGRSARLIAPLGADDQWGLAFEVGDVWEVETERASKIVAPHVENLVVHSRRKVREVADCLPTIERHMPPVDGGTEALYYGKTRVRPGGALTIVQDDVPAFSTLFWRPDQPLRADITGKRIRYFYPHPDGQRSLAFVGFQEPVYEIPAGTLLRVSLSHWWRSPETPNEDMRCWVQLSGWFGKIASKPLGMHLADHHSSSLHPEELDPMVRARSELRRVFGFSEFRPLQEQIVANVLYGNDTLGVMPTGAGKSLCYQIPSLTFDRLTVVISPLLSLMQDQIDQLRAAGVFAVTLNSLISYAEYTENIRQIRAGRAKLLYLAPETLLRPEILALLDESSVALLTIDEAHCISEWGHDFRPEYRQLRVIRKRYPNATCLALTATATERVREDIRTSLGIDPGNTFISGFDRPNLYLEVQRRAPTLTQLKRFLAAHRGQPGIIYCSTRKQVEQLAEQLSTAGIDALPYHAGMADAARRENQRRFQRDDVQIIVATIAFGMGINKSNVRFVVHCTLPECIETYYQQIGRAGRDGLRADCLLLFGRQDIGTITRFIEEGAQAERAGRTARMQVMVRYAEATFCRRIPLLTYFGDPGPEEPCGMCDNCEAESAGRTEVDVSEDARLFLRCVLHTGQKFGVTHVVDVLRGSVSARLLRWKHNELTCYGSGKHRGKEEWRALADRFLERGLLEAELEHSTLRITDAGRRVLEGDSVHVPEVVIAPPPPAAKSPTIGREAHDPALFETLRLLRKKLADEANVAAFVIFSDRTLVEMASLCPRSLVELTRIHGVGEKKMTVYGPLFLEAIKKYLGEKTVAQRPPLEEASWFSTGKKLVGYVEVAAAFLDGASISELSSRWTVKPGTIVNHLCDYVEAGGSLDADRVLGECRLSAEERAKALRLFDESENDYLGPVREAMGGSVSYDDLRLLRIYRSLKRRDDR